jgi:hypothetical protein
MKISAQSRSTPADTHDPIANARGMQPPLLHILQPQSEGRRTPTLASAAARAATVPVPSTSGAFEDEDIAHIKVNRLDMPLNWILGSQRATSSTRIHWPFFNNLIMQRIKWQQQWLRDVSGLKQ